jgi:hypothetical protein
MSQANNSAHPTLHTSSYYSAEDVCMVGLVDLKQDSGYGAVNGTTFGVHFFGGHFPQKLTPKTSTEPQYKLFQRHVSFYILKGSPVCFVWAVPPLLISPYLYNIALNLFVAVGNQIRLV